MPPRTGATLINHKQKKRRRRKKTKKNTTVTGKQKKAPAAGKNQTYPPAVKSQQSPQVGTSRRPTRRSSSMQIQVHKEVDARGLMCPLPILRAKKALADMESGQILKVLATDPGSQRDFAAFSKQTGNELVESSVHEKVFTFLMKRR
ncbi:TusA-related sulfurtransferase [Paraburkholderia sp. GAS199]